MSGEVSGLLLAASATDDTALRRLIPVVYGELRRLARGCTRREPAGHTAQTTAVIDNTYQRLIKTPRVRCRHSAHFLPICAQLMRRLLVDHAPSRRYQKGSGNIHLVPIEQAATVHRNRGGDIIAVDGAFGALTADDRRKAQIVRNWKVLRELSGGNP